MSADCYIDKVCMINERPVFINRWFIGHKSVWKEEVMAIEGIKPEEETSGFQATPLTADQTRELVENLCFSEHSNLHSDLELCDEIVEAIKESEVFWQVTIEY